MKTEPALRKRRDELRARLGWIDTAVQIEEIPVRMPTNISNKYFRVEHRAI